MSDQYKRAETGSIQFGEDWPGVFIRGDNAGWIAMNLSVLLDQLEEQPEVSMEGLIALKEAIGILSGSGSPTTILKPFKECCIRDSSGEDGS